MQNVNTIFPSNCKNYFIFISSYEKMSNIFLPTIIFLLPIFGASSNSDQDEPVGGKSPHNPNKKVAYDPSLAVGIYY